MGVIITLASREKRVLALISEATRCYSDFILPFLVILKRMKVSRPQNIYIVILMVIFGGIVLHAPLSVGLGVLFPDYSLLIKSWKEILMIIAAIMAVSIVTRRHLWRELLNDWIIRLISAFAVLHMVLIPFLYQGAASVAAGLAIDLRFLLFFGLMYVAMKVLPRYRARMVQIGIVGAFIVVCFATLQLFLPPDILSYIGYSRDTIMPYLTIDKNPNYIRVNSTLRGPNPMGAYAGMVLGLLTAALLKGRLQMRDRKTYILTGILATCSIIALWISYSRSALVAGVATVLVVLAAVAIQRMSRRAWIAGFVIVFAFAGSVVASMGSPFVSNILLHENPDGGSVISSNDDHVKSLESGLRELVTQPLGAGIGSTGSASLFSDNHTVIENQYLFVAHEAGWLGLLLFVALYALILLKLWRRRSDWLSLGVFASGIGLGIIGLLLPVWADDTVSIVWWGLAAIALGGNYAGKQTK